MKKQSFCKICKAKIQFVLIPRSSKFMTVDDYPIGAIERLSRQQGIPIPFDARVHKKHECRKPKMSQADYSAVYRG